jgi:hypothetical protein
VASFDAKQRLVEDLFSRAPSKTKWAEEMAGLSASLTGASEYELDKLDPMSEQELTRIFPRASATVMKDPLTLQDKQRIHDNIRRDPYTGIALFTYCYFMLGPESNITMGLNRKYANEQRKKDQMDFIQNNAEYLDILEDIMNRDDDMDLQTRKLQLVFQGSAFGRAVMIKQYDKRLLPCRLIPLSPTRLGRVWIDRKTWEFLGVEYNDYSRDHRILLAKDIIHYENNDMMITPRSRYYGMSMLESTMALGERNRVANEIAMPEIMRKDWHPLITVRVNTGSQTKLNKVRDMFSMPGKNYVYNDDIEVNVHPIPHDLDKLQSAIENGAKDINRALTVPQGIGWSYDPNHATMENSLLAWYNGVLAFKRSHLDSVLWLQLYKPQLETIWTERQMSQMRLLDMSGMVNQLVQNAEQYQQQQENGNGNGKPALPFRITTEFKNIKTTGFLELSSALLGWEAAGIITPEIARTEGGLGQYNDDMAEHEQKQALLPNNLLSQEQNMMGTMMGQGIQGVNPINTSTGQTAVNALPSGQPHASTSG